jgi:hypothetical protein
MRIFEVDTTNEMLSVLNDINVDFEDKFNKLKSLVEYIESNKCPWIDENWLTELKTLHSELLDFWKIKGLNRSDPDLIKIREINKQVTLILKKYS